MVAIGGMRNSAPYQKNTYQSSNVEFDYKMIRRSGSSTSILVTDKYIQLLKFLWEIFLLE